MEPDEFRDMARQIRDTETLLGSSALGASKGERDGLLMRRSLFAVHEIQEGEKFTVRNIRPIRPGEGLPPKYYFAILGKKAKCKIEKGTPLQSDLIEWETVY